MPILGQQVFYYSQPNEDLIANPAMYLGPAIETPGKDALTVFCTPLGGSTVVRLEATLVTADPVVGDYSEALLI